MALTQQEFDTFEKLILSKHKKELDCRPYLEHASHLLIQRTLRSSVNFIEIRSFVGDADLAVVAEIVNDNGDSETWAYFWELKAPQCYLFEYDAVKSRPTATPFSRAMLTPLELGRRFFLLAVVAYPRSA